MSKVFLINIKLIGFITFWRNFINRSFMGRKKKNWSMNFKDWVWKLIKNLFSDRGRPSLEDELMIPLQVRSNSTPARRSLSRSSSRYCSISDLKVIFDLTRHKNYKGFIKFLIFFQFCEFPLSRILSVKISSNSFSFSEDNI